MSSLHPPSGFRDFINDEARRRLYLMNEISKVYQSFGFSPLETPVLENLDILIGGGGQENEKLIFKILKRGAKFQEGLEKAVQNKDENSIAEYGLRFDMTMPLSRAVAAHRSEIHFPWKVFHQGPVWRADRPQKGRYREFVQCDVDIIGAKGIGAEIEVIQAVVTAIHHVGATGFELCLNDRRIVQGMATHFGFTAEKLEAFAIILDKKDKMEFEELTQTLSDLLGKPLPAELILFLKGEMTLEGAKAYHPEAAQDLTSMMAILKELDLPLTGIVFDPSLVRGMGYYTGPVFELRHASAGYSFGGGGRYDQLIGRLSGQEIPACGFSIGFERLALLLEENEVQSKVESKTVFIPVFDESLRSKVCSVAMKLRSAGKCVDVYPDRAKIKNQFKFASDSGYRWVLIIGDQEWNTQIFKIKDFKTGVEKEIQANDLNATLSELYAQDGLI